MATVQYGSIITNMRGSIGGTTFSGAGGLNVAKRRGAPPAPNSGGQRQLKASMMRWAPEWRNLSAPQRAGWAAYAAGVTFTNSLGQSYQIGGFQMWSRMCQFANSRGLAFKPVVPTLAGMPSAPTVTFDVVGGDLRLATLVPAPVGANIWAATIRLPSPPTWSEPRGRVVNTFNGDGTGLPVVIAAGYTALLEPGADYKAWVEWRWYDANFRLSALVLGGVTFTA